VIGYVPTDREQEAIDYLFLEWDYGYDPKGAETFKYRINPNYFPFNRYQELAEETAIYPGKGEILGLMYCALGIAGEAGEIAEKVKKIFRDHNRIINEDQKRLLRKELGDVLWYLAQAAKELDNTKLGQVAVENINKLRERREKGTIHGNGDER
jgi:NTP pyrophosphatase (non-canonical NTP hydrolase)